MRLRKKKNLTPRMERCGDIWVKQPDTRRGQWLQDRTETELHLEIGSGRGRFTVETAASVPSALLVAIEREPNATIVAMERARGMELGNILFVDGDAAKLTEMFAPGEVARIYLNFSDPWPARRHEKRRLTSPGFLEMYRRILTSDGEIHFKTDNRPLFDYSVRQFPACGYALDEVTYDLHEQDIVGVMTDYEAKFHELGLPICRCVARLEAQHD
ncbi:MAG: tRNA (guanosine(46)-N7)-methyltransferase TrmB [Oscillospiraceae bacterium]|nr:tRNA (guanosine(46)-N7)-methyltransferase TrmB [Oscillospiraceae bacterium]